MCGHEDEEKMLTDARKLATLVEAKAVFEKNVVAESQFLCARPVVGLTLSVPGHATKNVLLETPSTSGEVSALGRLRIITRRCNNRVR